MKLNEDHKATICKATGLSSDAYDSLVYEMGLNYLEHYLPNDKWAQKLLSYSKQYWAWWVNQWNRRAGIFIYKNELKQFKKPAEAIYTEFIKENNANSMIAYPNIENSYAEMIQELIKATHNQPTP